MSDQWPRMIYKVGTQEAMHGGFYDYELVYDQTALDVLLANGWHMTTAEAKAADEAAKLPVPVDLPQDDPIPSRAEIEKQATVLGIKFDGRTTDAKLLAKIDVELDKQAPQ